MSRRVNFSIGLGFFSFARAQFIFVGQLIRIDSAIDGIVRKAVAGNPQDRYGSVTDLHRNITRFMSDYGTSVQTRSLIREASLFVKQHKEAFVAIIAAATMLLILLTIFIYHLVAKERVSQRSLIAGFAFPDDRLAISVAGIDMGVEAVVRDVGLAAAKPLGRCGRLV